MTGGGDKVAFVTGGGSGIGRAAARRFAEAGAAVAVVDLAGDSAEETAALIREAGGEAVALIADVAESAAVERAVAATVARFGRLDWAFNNAGVSGGSPGPDDWDEAILAHALAVNVTGTLACMKHQVARMLERGGGAIVNMASVAGLVGVGGFAYAASKHAVVGLTKAAGARYAARGIRINAVCPGSVRTPMIERAEQRSPGMVDKLVVSHPIGRLAEADEIADVVLWLCSEQSSYVVGQAIAADGGFTAL